MNQISTTENQRTESKSKDLRESMKLFGVDDSEKIDIDKEFSYEINIPKDTTDKIFTISRLIRVATLTISGYEEIPSKGNEKSSYFKLVKNPLASSEVIKHFESLLKPYADESNIVTKKNWDSFKIQALSDWSAFYKFCLREKASPEESERTVYRVFQGCIINIGEITCDNPENMKTLFGQVNRNVDDDVRRNALQ